MKRSSTKSQNKSSSRSVKYKFDIKDTSVIKNTWKSPNDRKDNFLNIQMNPKSVNFIEIKDNH